MDNNKHVFSELVTDIDNPEHLIAYALYKNHKHNLAIGLIGEEKEQEEIEARLEQEKQNTLSNPIALQKYRDDAAIYLSKVLESATGRLKQEYAADLERERKAIKADLKELQRQWLRKVDAQRVADAKDKNIERMMIVLTWIKNQIIAHLGKLIFFSILTVLGLTGKISQFNSWLETEFIKPPTETTEDNRSTKTTKKAAE